MRFYRCDVSPLGLATVLPANYSIRLWQPGRDGLPPRESFRPRNLAWWAFARLRLFARDDFAELTIWHKGQMVHRLIVTPRWHRFPFMGDRDLQIGDLWTHPDARRRGLARAAIGEVLARFGSDSGRYWYVVDSANRASIRLIESCGFRLAGIGRRTRPLGLRLLGRFKLESNLI
jgi:RimJ/RimL family protein N-acetyltransferase